MNFGNQQINTHPCTQAEADANWNTVQYYIDSFSATIIASPTYKVKVNSADAAPDYLHAKLTNPGDDNFDGGLHVAVVADVVSDATVRLYWRPEDIAGYAAAERVLALDAFGVMNWTVIDVGTDAFTVMITAGDTTPSYLHDAFNLNATYVGNADILIATETVGSAATNQKERPFVDVSIISGWHATEFRVLGIKANTTAYYSPTDFADNLFGGITLTNLSYDAGTNTLSSSAGGSTAKIGVVYSAITARSGLTAGSGLVDVYSISGATLSDASTQETWYNLAEQTIAAGSWVMAKSVNGQMIIDFEGCSGY